MKENINNSLVSVIIPTYNSFKNIENCLKSIKEQTYRNIELIVIDNNSIDNTKKVALKYTKQVFNKGPERTFQKNFGIKKANGKYIFFVDSDMYLEKKVIKECVELYSNNNDIGGICIPERSIGKGFFVKIRDFERSFYEGTSVESARFFSLLDVKNVGGFEEDLIFFEESLLPQKIEERLKRSCKYRISSYINHDEGDINLIKWLVKKFYYGKSLDEYKKKVIEIGIKETGDNQMGVIKRYLIFFKNKRFYKKPILALGVLILKTLEFGSGFLGLLFSKIKNNYF